MPAKKKSITLKQWIDYTKKALEGTEGNPIWTVMTAMRGPDTDETDEGPTNLKWETTARLRYATFGNAPHDGGVPDGMPSYHSIGADVNPDGKYVVVNDKFRVCYDHFGRHIRHAYDELLKIGLIKQ